MDPTKEREAELVAIYRDQLGGTLDLGEYHDFDGLIEGTEEMTFEEWEWMRDHYEGRAEIHLTRKN